MKKLILLATVLLSACTSFDNQNRYPSNIAQCPISEKNPPAFTVLENKNGKIKVQLNNFTKLFDLSDAYNVKVTFEDLIIQDADGSNAFTNVTDVAAVTVNKEPFIVEVPVARSGIYNFYLSD